MWHFFQILPFFYLVHDRVPGPGAWANVDVEGEAEESIVAELGV